MLVRPMIASWEPPRVARIRSMESRRLAVLPVAGLSGDLHQDLGRGALAIEIIGSLSDDESRDDFLKEVREKFLAGDPVDFVADIVKESELEQVLIEGLDFEESSDADMFRYRIVLREYTEPPDPPAASTDADLSDAIGLDADIGLDGLDLPAILGAVPPLGDILSPVKSGASALKDKLGGTGALLDPLKNLLDGGA